MDKKESRPYARGYELIDLVSLDKWGSSEFETELDMLSPADLAELQGHLETAVAAAQVALESDPTNEEKQRNLTELNKRLELVEKNRGEF